MWSPTDCASNWVMNSVIIDEERHTEDVHGQVDWHDEEDAHAIIFGHREEVVLGVDFDPLLVVHEVDVGVDGIAWSED